MAKPEKYQFAISLSVLNHLGRNLYRNFVTVLGEAISNSWDADAENVWIDIDRDAGTFIIGDDGRGMTADDFQNRFLKIGYSKRKEGGSRSPSGRPFIGAKGIGKLALLSCARRISVFTRVSADDDFTGGTIDNSGLDAAITNDLVPEDYPLEPLDFGLIDDMYTDDHVGTLIVFEGASEILKNSDEHIRKVLALSFAFSLIDPKFTIHVNDEPLGVADLLSLAESSQFLWSINAFESEYTKSLTNLLEPIQELKTKLPVKGFIASVTLPRHLKIRGTEERATVDLFVNGRLRERNIIRHTPTQRIVESYIYGQLHVDTLDREGADPFTSSREGIVEDDSIFQALLDYVRRELLPKIIDDWDRLRLKHGREGDDDNTRKTRKQRKAASLIEAAEDEYRPPEGEGGEEDDVDNWLKQLRPDAEFNVSAYVDCFLSENLVRKYIKGHSIPLTKVAQKDADEWKAIEAKRLAEANINFDVRKDGDDLSYLDMDKLAICAEGTKSSGGKPTPLVQNAVAFKPVRNAVGHTGLLTDNAKTHLTLTLENVKGRLKNLLKTKPKKN
jgi:hypothetical protein